MLMMQPANSDKILICTVDTDVVVLAVANAIPDHTKQSNTLPMFKAKSKTILIQNG